MSGSGARYLVYWADRGFADKPDCKRLLGQCRVGSGMQTPTTEARFPARRSDRARAFSGARRLFAGEDDGRHSGIRARADGERYRQDVRGAGFIRCLAGSARGRSARVDGGKRGGEKHAVQDHRRPGRSDHRHHDAGRSALRAGQPQGSGSARRTDGDAGTEPAAYVVGG